MTTIDDLDVLVRELRTDKVATRQKAFSKLSSVCSSNGNALHKIFRKIDNNSGLSYESLFYSAHEGIKLQGSKLGDAEIHEGDNRIKIYSSALHDLLAASLDVKAPVHATIQPVTILQSVIEILTTDYLLKHFGNAYLSVLNSLLSASTLNITLIQCDDWKKILKILLKLMNKDLPKFKFLFLVDVTQKVVTAGCTYSYLAFEMCNLKVFEHIQTLLKSRTSNNYMREKQELLTLAYLCCKDVATDFRFTLCQFFEEMTEHLSSAFMSDTHDKYRPVLFKLMDLAVVVHNPNLGKDDQRQMEHVHDKKKWFAALRKYEELLLEELKPVKSIYREKLAPKVNSITSEFAARFCYYVYWNDDIWQPEEGSNEDEQRAKRKKYANKLQTIIDRIKPTQSQPTNWKWLIVLSELIENYPKSVQNDDFVDIIALLSESQHQIEFKEQIYAFTKCCSTLLSREESFKTTVNMFVYNRCEGLWAKISDEAARCCTNSNKNLIETHRLLQLLIYHRKYSSNAFIEGVIKIFTTNSTIKCDTTLQTLIVLLKNFNLDCLPNGKEHAKDILNFAFEKITLATLKKVIAGYERPSPRVLAELAILCCILKTDVINFFKSSKVDPASFYDKIVDLEEQINYRAYIDSIINLMGLRTRAKLCIESEDFPRVTEESLTQEDTADIPLELKCMIDESIFGELMKLTELPEKIVSDESSTMEIKDHLKDIMANNELMMNLLSELIKIEAVDQRKVEHLFITKRIVLNMQEIERMFMLVSSKSIEFDASDTHKIATAISFMFSNHYNVAVGKMIRSFSLKSCTKWLFDQVDKTFGNASSDDQNKTISLKAFQSCKQEKKLRYLLITTLCEYFNYDGIDANHVMEMIDKIDFIEDDIVDLHTILKVIDIFGQQRNVPQDLAIWIWETGIVPIFQNHKHNLYIMSCMIEKFPKLKQFTQQECDALEKNHATIYKSLSKLCTFDANNKRCFGPKIAARYLHQFRHFHEIYFELYTEQQIVKLMYEKIYTEFLTSASFEVRMAAINAFSTILFSDCQASSSIEQQKIKNNLRKALYKGFIDTYECTLRENEDENVSDLSGHLQLFVSLFCVNYNFKRPNLFELAKIFIDFNLTEREGVDIFAKIMKHLKCVRSTSIINLNDIVDLVTKWIDVSLEMSKFPWYLTGSTSYEDFLSSHYRLVFLAALKAKEEVLNDFLNSVEQTLIDAAFPIISNCLAFLIPSWAKCVVKYEASVCEMIRRLSPAFDANQLTNLIKPNIPEIVVGILENVIDNAKFLEMSGFQMDFCSGYESIKFQDFDKCLKYIKRVCGAPKDQNLMTFLCKSNSSFVQQIFMLQKRNIQGTELIEHKMLSLLQYNILVNEIIEYMIETKDQQEKTINEYLCREIANFFCYLTVNKECGEKLSLIAADSLLNYFKNIIPTCSVHIKSQLQRVIPQLVAHCKISKSSAIKAKCFEIMNFLVLNQKSLNDAIALLDRFPSSAEFDELRTKQLAIKYQNGEFILMQEIEHFLEISNRRIEGLTSLFEHLSSKKSELTNLFDELNSISDDKERSLLHRLIRSLIAYIRASDEERAVEAIKCLGEIGCHNVSTLIFNAEDPENDTTYMSFSKVVECQRFMCSKILEKLEGLIVHHNVNIFQVASEACYYLLQNASSIDFRPSAFFNPFLPAEKISENLFYLEPKSNKTLGLKAFLVGHSFIEYSQFMKAFCVSMTEFAGDKVLALLIQTQLEFAEMIFPLVFHLLLLYNNEAVNSEILETIMFYFEQCFEKLNYSERTNEGSIFINRKIIRQMLKLVEKIRIFCQENPKSRMTAMQDFNYLHMSKAAKHCEASFSAIQYCEMWARKQQECQNVEFSVSIKDKSLEEIMYRSYKEIGIQEAAEIFLNPVTNRAEYLKTHGLNFQSLLELSRNSSFEEYMKLLNDVGLYQITHKANENLDQGKKLQQYECLWKLCEWNTIVETDTEIKDEKGFIDYREEFEKYHYLSLQYSSNNDAVGIRNALYKSRKMILQLITNHILECSNSLYNFLEMSHRLAQIEDFSQVLFKRSQNTHEVLLQKWSIHDELPNDYEHCKNVLLQRNSILSTANIKAGKRSWVPDAVQSNSLFVIQQSVLAGQHNDALRLITQLRDSITSIPRKMEVLIEEAKLNSKTDRELAKSCLLQVMENSLLGTDEFIIQSTAHRLYGEILAESYSEEFNGIFKKYFEKSMKYLEKYAMGQNKNYIIANLSSEEEVSQCSQALFHEENSTPIDTKIRQASCIYDTIARYFDREYEFKSSYLKSPDFIQKKNTYRKNKERLSLMSNGSNRTDKDSRSSVIILQKSTELDRQEIENAEKEKSFAARNATYYYLRSTIYGADENIASIFRIISLMLSNYQSSLFISNLYDENLHRIPSYKFIITLPQVTVRLSDLKGNPLNIILKKLLKRCAIDHPHHTLPLVLALVNSYADSDTSVRDEPRVVGAKDLWMSLKREKSLKQTIHEMEQMSTALIDLANLPLKTSFIPPNDRLLKLQNLSSVQCPTIELPVVKNGDYKKSLITVEKWDSTVKGVGGINAPKRIEVLCSDGIKRPQLLKGRDDMRQDAIMMQIFSVVNKSLLLDKNMQKSHARIRTYKVVPFSRRSGILEWCQNTIPIGLYLVGERDTAGKLIKKGAHELLRPQDWKPMECFHKVSDLSAVKNPEEKVEKFNAICKNIKPVFHHFFYERFKSPGEHFERRYAYTTSVAVSSMIGYILGIGDRHVQNILIDLKTAEMIHIDFGVAFEQGKILPHPELIPFRLTRDIVAPFGVSGVDGIFRKTCENTLKILRQNEKALTTILEVLLYDPMYMWSLGAEQARRAQLGGSEEDCVDSGETVEHDLMASRALNCVKMKLEGMGENSVQYPSIDGQVQFLIQAAMNPQYLSRLFRGWQAYL